MTGNVISYLPPKTVPDTNVAILKVVVVVAATVTIPVRGTVIFTFFSAPTVEGVDDVSKVVACVLTFFIERIGGPRGIDTVVILNLAESIPLIQVPSVGDVRGKVGGDARVISFTDRRGVAKGGKGGTGGTGSA